MSSYESKELQLACPNQKCKRQMKVIYRDIYSSRKTKCGSCGTEINFDSSVTSDFKSSVEDMNRIEERYKDDMKKAQGRIDKAVAGILKNAEIKVKL